MAFPPIDWEFRLDDGLGDDIYFNTAAEPDNDGVLWGMNGTPTGWEDGAGYRGSSVDIPFADGADVPDQWLGARSIHCTGIIVAPDPKVLAAAMRRLKRATRLLRADGKFYDQPIDGVGPRYCTVRRGGQPAFPTRHGPEAVSFDFLLLAGDPLKYSSEIVPVTVESSTVAGGVTFPLTFPVTFTSDADVSSATATSANGGDADAPFVVAFNPPLLHPALIDRATGNRIVLTPELRSGPPVLVDTRSETVSVGGETVYDWLDTSQSTPLSEFRIPAFGSCQWLLLGAGSGNAVVSSQSTWE